MAHTLRYVPKYEMFYIEYGDSARLHTLIQVWNSGVSESHIRETLISPNEVIHLEYNAPRTVSGETPRCDTQHQENDENA